MTAMTNFLQKTTTIKYLKTLTSLFSLGNGYINNVTFLSSLDILFYLFFEIIPTIYQKICVLVHADTKQFRVSLSISPCFILK